VISRRALLGAGVTASAIGAGAALLPDVGALMGGAPPTRGLRGIDHVVLLMQENRSFDSYFGTLRGVRGFDDRAVLPNRAGGTVFGQRDRRDHPVLPFEIAASGSTTGNSPQDVGSIEHGWTTAHQVWADGWWDGWVRTRGAATMAAYGASDVSFQRALADAFTICDAYHCSALGPTTPNRNYFMTGYTGFEPGTRRRAVGNAARNDAHPGYDWVTYPELLDQAGVSWRLYQEWDNYLDNTLEFFARFKSVMRAVLRQVDGGRFSTLHELYRTVRRSARADRQRLQAELADAAGRLSGEDARLYDRGLARLRPRTLGSTFADDVVNGRLPAVSYIVGPSRESEHPRLSTPAAGAGLTYEIVRALASTPDVWRRTALLVTYDENDGYFDHVPPPVPPHWHRDEWYAGQPIGLGARVAMTVVSPWTVGGHVSSQVFDHTSVVQFLERWTGVRTPVISDWRREACGDLTSVFDFTTSKAAPEVRPPPVALTPGPRWLPRPPARQSLPEQAPGARPARALPHQTDAGVVVADGTARITLTNGGTVSAHFVVSGYRGETARPVHLDVSQHATLALAVPRRAYRLVVSGPNRMLRDFSGRVDGPAAQLTIATSIDAATRRIKVTLDNAADARVDVRLHPLAYADASGTHVAVPARRRRRVDWRTDAAHGWYDLLVTVDQDPEFRHRLTGHIENGRPSRSAWDDDWI
jgi:phospholipase C